MRGRVQGAIEEKGQREGLRRKTGGNSDTGRQKRRKREMEGLRHAETESEGDLDRQKEKTSEKIRDTDRQAQEGVDRGTGEDGLVRHAELP